MSPVFVCIFFSCVEVFSLIDLSFNEPTTCIVTAIWHRGKPLNQWQRSFQMKAALSLVNRLATAPYPGSEAGLWENVICSLFITFVFCMRMRGTGKWCIELTSDFRSQPKQTIVATNMEMKCNFAMKQKPGICNTSFYWLPLLIDHLYFVIFWQSK